MNEIFFKISMKCPIKTQFEEFDEIDDNKTTVSYLNVLNVVNYDIKGLIADIDVIRHTFLIIHFFSIPTMHFYSVFVH